MNNFILSEFENFSENRQILRKILLKTDSSKNRKHKLLEKLNT